MISGLLHPQTGAPCHELQHLWGSLQGPELGLRLGSVTPKLKPFAGLGKGAGSKEQSREVLSPAILESAATAWALFAFRGGLHSLSPVMPALLLHTSHPSPVAGASVGPTLPPGWQPGGWQQGPPAQ